MHLLTTVPNPPPYVSPKKLCQAMLDLLEPKMRLGTGAPEEFKQIPQSYYSYCPSPNFILLLVLHYKGRSIHPSIHPCSMLLWNVASYLLHSRQQLVIRQHSRQTTAATTRRSNFFQKFTHTFIFAIPPEIYILRQYISGIHFWSSSAPKLHYLTPTITSEFPQRSTTTNCPPVSLLSVHLKNQRKKFSHVDDS